MKKIIIVDDEPDVIYSIKEGLGNNYNIKSSTNGKQLFEILESYTPDLILLDIMMPEMNGWQIIKKLKQNEKMKNIPIIIITARKDKIAEKAGRFYAEDFIEKPFSMIDLKNRIEKIFLKY